MGLGLALVALLIAAMAIAMIASQQQVPEPFGLARNGTLVYAADGDIFAVDPDTGISTAIVSGPDTDTSPVFSRDGTHLVFARNVGAARGSGHLYVVKADGSDLTLITPESPIPNGPFQFSPDGSEVMFTALVDRISTIHIARSDGTGVRTLETGVAAFSPDYRPRDGAEIVFIGTDDNRVSGMEEISGVYSIRPDSTGLRTIVEPTNMVFDYARWSPDGSEIAYTAWGGPDDDPARIWVTPADGLSTRVLPTLPTTVVEGVPVWSNDGTRLLVWRCLVPPEGDDCISRLAVVPADGRDTGIQLEIDVLLDDDDSRWTQLWAPDDTSVLVAASDRGQNSFAGVVRWDPVTGQTSSVTWTPDGPPSWQRLAR